MRAPLLLAAASLLGGCAQILGGSDLDDLRPATSPDDQNAATDAGGRVLRDGGIGQEAGRSLDSGIEDTAPPPPARDGATDSEAPADGAADTGPVDCASLAPGDLVIVELMVASQSGSGDHGEWLEVKSTRACRLNLRGLHVESPRGPTSDTVDVTSDTYLAGGGSFLVADSTDATINHGLSGMVLAWQGSVGDALKNSGDTVALSIGGVLLDSITYDTTLPWLPGASLEFPASCAPSARTTWSSWRYPSQTYGGLYIGTPNGPNVDVACP